MNNDLAESIQALQEKQKANTDMLESRIKVNESLGQAAFFYEKLRNAIDYQDEHLFLKNAIKRILKRRAYIGLAQSGEKLLHELVWARYFKNDTLPSSYSEQINKILAKYNALQQKVTSSHRANLVLSYSACEIEEFLCPAKGEGRFALFVKNLIAKNIEIPPDEMDSTAIEMQVLISIEKLIFKSDHDEMRFKLLRFFYPQWPKISPEQLSDFKERFEEITELIDLHILENRNSKIFKYVRRNIPPFIVLWDTIRQNPTDAKSILESKDSLHSKAFLIIGQKNRSIYKKVFRSIVRGIIFILTTKVILAFALELPYELSVYGQANYVALATNTALPPVLMLITSFFISIPGRRNSDLLAKMLEMAVFENELYAKKLETSRPIRTPGYVLFNLVYSALSLAILALVVWALISLQFNIISIILFFVFVSIVSFLAFRIRATAKELEVKSKDDSLLLGVFNFVLLPFVIIGKFLSDKWSDYNFTLLFWDFIVEAPFKAIISVFEAWLSFVREKREDFE